jgi:hypothetical protein
MDDPTSEEVEANANHPVRNRWRAVVREVRSRPFGYTVLFLFVLAGPFAAPFLFPQAPPAVAIFGGLAFGLYAALCAVPQKFL